MAPTDRGGADLRAGDAGCAPLPLRSPGRRPSRARPSSVARRWHSLAKPADVGLIRRSTGWRRGPGRLARPLVRGRRAGRRRTGRRRTGHPLPSGRGPAGSTAMCSTFCGESLPTARPQPTPVLRRGPKPGSELPPDGNRHRADVQPTQLKSRQPTLARLVGARFCDHAKAQALHVGVQPTERSVPAPQATPPRAFDRGRIAAEGM
jgi:hypothetical protein